MVTVPSPSLLGPQQKPPEPGQSGGCRKKTCEPKRLSSLPMPAGPGTTEELVALWPAALCTPVNSCCPTTDTFLVARAPMCWGSAHAVCVRVGGSSAWCWRKVAWSLGLLVRAVEDTFV